jgi:2-polyprenyl-3-methyl-5-hydroxy-6-metoxy-1,4-benzoquinol methylase
VGNYFVFPPILDDPIDLKIGKGCKTFSECHYTKSTPLESYIKTRHFEVALRLTKNYFHSCSVIDFGCGDGPFLPSLAKYFDHVTGIDFESDQIELSRRLCRQEGLCNVDLICASSNEIAKIREILGARRYTILFLLETLEHIGDTAAFYESKIDFLKEVFSLLDDKGLIVMSVPVMVGLPFLLQRTGLRLLGKYREPLSTVELLRAVLWADTKRLEKNWNSGKHLGFNHLYLEALFNRGFLVEKKDLFFQIVYVLRRI